MKKLDERHEKNRGSCWVEGKKRKAGSPSKRPQPEGFPPTFFRPVSMSEVPEAEAEEEIEQEDSDFNPNDFSV